MATPAQTIFPPKPKVFSTPLRPIPADKRMINPLLPKVTQDAIKEESLKERLQEQREGGGQGGQAAKASRRHRVQREAQSE